MIFLLRIYCENHLLKKQDLFEDPTLPLQVYIRDPQPEFPLHSHGFDELVIILKGTARHVIDEQTFPVRAGDVFVIAQNHEHQYQQMQGLAPITTLIRSGRRIRWIQTIRSGGQPPLSPTEQQTAGPWRRRAGQYGSGQTFPAAVGYEEAVEEVTERAHQRGEVALALAGRSALDQATPYR